MAFHQEYSNLLNQLPPSLIQESWRRLTTRKRKPLSENEASNINPIIEVFLRHEVVRYQRKKLRQRRNHTLQLENQNITKNSTMDKRSKSSVTLSESDIREIKDALNSAEISINKLEKENRELLDIINAKEQKIIALIEAKHDPELRTYPTH